MEVAVKPPVRRDEMADLRVVGAQVLIDEVVRELLRAPQVAEQREDERRVGERRRVRAAEAVVVVPCERCVVRLVGVESAARGVVVGNGAEVIVAESGQVCDTSSIVTGETPVMKRRLRGASSDVVRDLIAVKNCLKNPSPWQSLA